MKRLALVVLVACGAHHQAEAEDFDYRERHEHPCDPKGASVARYVEPEALERELFPDEIALRGKCLEEPKDFHYYRRPDEAATDLMREVVSRSRECTGVCKPMEASLPELDEKHDLEDETLQRECTTAAAKLEANIRGGCRHVCLVERRKLASKAIFARTMHGLWSFSEKLPAVRAGDDDVRKMWIAAKEPLPPRRFRLAIEPGKEMKAEGAFYPGGPMLRLHLAEGDAGCGQSQWTVEKW